MIQKRRLTAAPLLCAAGLLVACSAGCEKSNSAAEKPAAPPVKVVVATPVEREVTDF